MWSAIHSSARRSLGVSRSKTPILFFCMIVQMLAEQNTKAEVIKDRHLEANRERNSAPGEIKSYAGICWNRTEDVSQASDRREG